MSKITFNASWDQADLLGQLNKVAAAVKITPQPHFPQSPPRKIGRVLYLPVEIASRELPTKARLAGDMARRGFQVVVGAAWNIFIELYRGLPPGLVLFKTLNAHDANNMHLIQQRGHMVAALNEEAFGLLPEAWIYRTEMNDQALRLADMICAQGKRSAAVLRDISGGEVSVTGNPRAVSEKSARGEEILVCMMAGNINGYLPFPNYMEMTLNALGKTDGDTLRLMQEQIAHEGKHMSLMLESIEALSRRFPSRCIIVRPHPAENRSIYETSGNVVLDDSRSLSERMKDAGVVVFLSGCGSGLEAFLSEIPGVRIGTGGHGISAELHLTAASPAEVCEAVAAQLENPRMIGSLTDHFAPVTLEDELDKLQAENSMPLDVDIAETWSQRADAFEPQGFHQNKFPDTADEHVSELAGLPAQRLGWNTWLVKM
jgi:surface carbohydrate biosynthesis protein